MLLSVNFQLLSRFVAKDHFFKNQASILSVLVDFFGKRGPIKMLAAGSNTSAALTGKAHSSDNLMLRSHGQIKRYTLPFMFNGSLRHDDT